MGSSTTRGSFQAVLTNRVGLTATSSVFNLVKDSTAPTAEIAAPSQSGLLVPVSWQGTDTGEAGLGTYTVQVRAGAGDWSDWLVDTSATEAEYMGTSGESYTFRVQAADRVGNTSDWVESGPCQPAVTKYYHFGGKPVAMRRGSGTAWPLTYLAGDHLGSVSLATSATGAVVSEARYTPFGEVRWDDGAGVTDLNFTGQRKDGFGLLDFHARFYDPALQRWLQADKIVPQPGNPLDWDRYQYVRSNPLRYTDPSGRKPACGMSMWDSGKTGNDNRTDCIGHTGATYPKKWTPKPVTYTVYIGLMSGGSPQAPAQSPPSEKSPAPAQTNTLEDLWQTANWSGQSPDGITLYQSQGYPVLGGFRVYADAEAAFNNNSPVTMGPSTIDWGPVEVGPDSVSFQSGPSTLDALSSSLNVGIDADFLDPWALDVSVDQALTVDNTEVTLTYGVQYVARPDNLTLLSAGVLGGAFGVRAAAFFMSMGRIAASKPGFGYP